LLGKFMPRDQERIRAHYNKAAIRQCFQELFAGDQCKRLYGFEPKLFHGRGAIYDDKPLLDLEKLPEDIPLAILTGRSLEEAQVGMELVGLADKIPSNRWITKKDGFFKPSPAGLQALIKRLKPEGAAIYIGDTLDDLKTAQAYSANPTGSEMISALVLSGPAGQYNKRLYEKSDADIIADDVNEVLRWINEARQ